MGDVFIEYLVKRKSTPAILLAKVGIGAATALLATVLLVFSRMSGLFSTMALFAAAGAAYAGYRLITRLDVEFEYTVTNGELDVDKIIAKRKRERLANIECREAEGFGKYSAKALEGKDFVRKVVACADISADDVWYIVARKDKGLVLILFSANDKILNAMKPFLPRLLANAAFRQQG